MGDTRSFAASSFKINPKGRDGKPLKCSCCGSIRHLWRQCDAPNAEEFKAQRRALPPSSSNRRTFTTRQLHDGRTCEDQDITQAMHAANASGSSELPVQDARSFPSIFRPIAFFSSEAPSNSKQNSPTIVELVDSRQEEIRTGVDHGAEAVRILGNIFDFEENPNRIRAVDSGSPSFKSNEEDARAGDGSRCGGSDHAYVHRQEAKTIDWWCGPVGFGDAEECLQAWHQSTILGPEEEGLLVDPGAHDNVVGEKRVRRQEQFAKKSGRRVIRRPLKRRIGIQGVGDKAPEAKHLVEVPGAFRCSIDQQHVDHDGIFTAPEIPDSDIPFLLGRRSLKGLRAVLDMVNEKLYLMSSSQFHIEAPPGSIVIPLQESRSGHSMIPFSRFTSSFKQPTGTLAFPSTAVGADDCHRAPRLEESNADVATPIAHSEFDSRRQAQRSHKMDSSPFRAPGRCELQTPSEGEGEQDGPGMLASSRAPHAASL